MSPPKKHVEPSVRSMMTEDALTQFGEEREVPKPVPKFSKIVQPRREPKKKPEDLVEVVTYTDDTGAKHEFIGGEPVEAKEDPPPLVVEEAPEPKKLGERPKRDGSRAVACVCGSIGKATHFAQCKPADQQRCCHPLSPNVELVECPGCGRSWRMA